MKILIAGSRGFIGTHLVEYFRARKHEVVALSRERMPGMLYWDPQSQVLEREAVEGSEVIINLCGESIFGRWSEEKKKRIETSRLHTTQFLCDQLRRLKVLPKVYIGASAIGYYGNRPQEILEEDAAAGNDFLAQVCVQWETIPDALALKGVRVVLCRFGMVLGEEGGALKQMQKAFKTGMGGILGSGKQEVSWIAMEDVCRAIEHVMLYSKMHGAVNFVSPSVVTNAEFTRILAHTLNRPAALSLPKFALALLLGEGMDMLLASTHAVPKRLLETGFAFHYPTLDTALEKYCIKNNLYDTANNRQN